MVFDFHVQYILFYIFRYLDVVKLQYKFIIIIHKQPFIKYKININLMEFFYTKIYLYIDLYL
jgi:hypothetical protein